MSKNVKDYCRRPKIFEFYWNSFAWKVESEFWLMLKPNIIFMRNMEDKAVNDITNKNITETVHYY